MEGAGELEEAEADGKECNSWCAGAPVLGSSGLCNSEPYLGPEEGASPPLDSPWPSTFAAGAQPRTAALWILLISLASLYF